MKRTKLFLTSIAFILTFLVFVQACKKGNAADLSGTYTISAGETLQIPNNKNTATVTDLVDSRCPINADCVWAGVATVKLTFKNSASEQTIELCLGACNVASKPKTQDVTLNGFAYTLTLTDVTPYPGTSAGNKKATVVLQKK